VVAAIPLPGRPRWAAYDPVTDQVFVNIRDPAQILGIGAGSLTADQVIDVPVAGPHGLWLDGERLFCAAHGRVLVMLHRDSGAVLGTVLLPGEPDVVMHDPALRHLYIAIGEPGVICVVDSDRLHLLQTVPAGPGAHTLASTRTTTPSTRSFRAAAARRSTSISDPRAVAVRADCPQARRRAPSRRRRPLTELTAGSDVTLVSFAEVCHADEAQRGPGSRCLPPGPEALRSGFL
jgi:hypothetical protein